MKKIVLTYGLISGAMISAWMLASVAFVDCAQMMSDTSMYLGFTAMIIAFSFIFVAVRNFIKQNGGSISFGKAFQIGLYISLIASTCYVISWLIDYYCFVPDFMDKYSAQQLQNIRQSGATAAEIQSKTAEIQSMKAMYQNPIFVILFTYMEILPVGLIISLITALFLKRKPQQTGV